MRISRKGWTHGGQGTQQRPVPRVQRCQEVPTPKDPKLLLEAHPRAGASVVVIPALEMLLFSRGLAEELLQRASLVLARDANHTLLCYFFWSSIARPLSPLSSYWEGEKR